jgi:hypothetical protein
VLPGAVKPGLRGPRLWINSLIVAISFLKLAVFCTKPSTRFNHTLFIEFFLAPSGKHQTERFLGTPLALCLHIEGMIEDGEPIPPLSPVEKNRSDLANSDAVDILVTSVPDDPYLQCRGSGDRRRVADARLRLIMEGLHT